MISLRKAEDRGVANFGWLDSKHSFSFGSYYDQDHMGFSALRVINDDTVQGGAGFGTHGHKDMEIISYVTQGVIKHKDSMGNVQSLPKGEFQLMSAGTGVQHSEYNASDSDDLKFLQIWIVPDNTGGEPGYQQKQFGNSPGLTAVITPTGENGTLKIKQDARLSQLILAPGESLTLDVNEQRKYYIHQVDGSISIDNHQVNPGDGVKIESISMLSISNDSSQNATALLFDLP